MSNVPVTTPAGIVFPAAADGSRSTTQAGAAIVAAALEALSPELASAARAEHRWRRAYPTHFRRLVEGALVDTETALASARQGLDLAWQTMQWAEAGSEASIEARWQPAAGAERRTGEHLDTHTITGVGDARPAAWSIPYRGESLTGVRLRERIDAWEREGIIESSAATALHRAADHPEWFDLSDRTLVLLGAGSEAGPLSWLARWRARIVAVDIGRPAVWQKIAGLVHAGNATLHAPLHTGVPAGGDWTAVAGADLLTQTPAIARWVCAFGGPLDVAAHAYLDGERHVRVALAMDWVQRAACAARADTTLAFMATPTDVFAVPRNAALAAMAQYDARPLISRGLQSPLRLATGDRFFQPNVTQLLSTRSGAEFGIVDSLVIEQGPNYALAKRLQQWRATLARAAGHRVSLNIAPSTTTASVVKNPALAAGFAGADTFGIEVFEPETTNALMAALWVHDLRCDAAAAYPARALAHPFELFMDNACHGGLWRSAYTPRSALPFAAALGWIRGRTDQA